MSFAGAAQRAFRLRRITFNPALLANILMTLLAVVLTIVWRAVVAGWYVIFGLLLVPYRLLRRGSSKRKAEALRHREVMEALNKQAE